ncbi:DUF3365 domain-containing protein [Aequorivita sp. H23M31]|uniref:DUF3365 domain-containing protein n=1 Tax=Aequorivita ciconiae TaxID=2494375 RepID=A0A410G1G6_9FLAO|nr:DUF3365 domain-containing protein [Aequorivita sp. H23M31]QAA81116.1 DUF3365 domain-containing protein [Aequorivita sp. H23M31]
MKTVSIIFLLGLLMACNSKPKQSYSPIEENSDEIAMVTSQEHPGKQLMVNNCYMCHNPKASENDMIAPPMVAVKMHYLSEDLSKAEFVDEIISFLKIPSEEKSKMPGAIKKFGLMPYQFYPENTIRQIADYMFDHEIAEPEWFEEHYKKMHGDRPTMKGKMGRGKGMGMGRNQEDNSQQLSIEERGMQMAQATKAELGKNLMGQIQKNGVIAALDFCNIQAMPLTDSMSVVHKAHIRRVSDKPRNPKNKADAVELQHVQTFKNQIAAGKEPTPIVTTKGEKVEFYYPITTNSMCLRCHGTPRKELEALTLTNILKHYPDDKATGYGENEVRGIWSIEFSR